MNPILARSKTTKLTYSTRQQTRESGSILVLTLVFCALIAQFSLSAASTTESRLAIAENDQSSVRANFAAQSGMDYAINQLINNASWTGTAGDWVTLSAHQDFSIEVSFEEDDALAGTKAIIRSTGRSGDGQRTLRMEAIVGSGSSAGDAAAVFLSSNIELTQGKLNGDVLVPDMVGAVEDYYLDANGNQVWVLNEDPLGTLAIDSTNALKIVRQFTEDNHFKGNSDIELEDEPYKMPAWNMDGYVEPDPERLILEDVTLLDGMSTSQTVVVLLDPGETLTIQDCQLGGGVVVWAPADYNLRDGARNHVVVDSSNIGTGSTAHIGLMAPAASVSGGGGGLNFHGLCFWNSIQNLDQAHITGALVVINEIVACDKLNLNGHPQTLGNLPDGISFQGSGDGIDFLSSGEDYGEDE